MLITLIVKPVCLFGDGAGAAVLGAVEGDRGILAARIRSDGRYLEQLYSPGGGTRRKPTAETLAAGDHFFKMKGNELFKVAVRSMAEISREVLEEAGLSAEDVKLFIPHQANQRITDAVANKLNVESERVYSGYRPTRQHVVGVYSYRVGRVSGSGQDQPGRSGADGFVWRRRYLGRCAVALVECGVNSKW